MINPSDYFHASSEFSLNNLGKSIDYPAVQGKSGNSAPITFSHYFIDEMHGNRRMIPLDVSDNDINIRHIDITFQYWTKSGIISG